MLDATPWTNMALPEDVDADTLVTATDAHIIVEMLNNNGGMPVSVPANGSGPPYPDVNGDWLVNEADWQRVCNALNAGGIWNPPGGSTPPPGSPPPGPGTNTIPPEIMISSVPGAVDEMQVFTVSGTFTMAYGLTVGSLGGEFRVTAGIFQGSSSGDWSVTGYFVDDHGSGTASDTRTLRFEVYNNLSPTIIGKASATITVSNVNPSLQIVSLGEFDEGSVATIDITMIDAANGYGIASDTWTVVVDWGDGQTETIQTAQDSEPSTLWYWTMIPPPPINPPVPPTFPHRTATHVYLDDNPTATPQDLYTITATITDDDTGTGSGTDTILIKNVAPTLRIDRIDPINTVLDDDTALNPSRIDEGEGFKVYGTLTDVGILDTHTGNIKVDLNYDGDKDDAGETVPVAFTPAGTGIWTFVGTIAKIEDDGPSNLGWESNITSQDPIDVLVEARDDDMPSSIPPVTASKTATVYNVAPTLSAGWLPLFGLDGVVYAVTVSGSFSDLGVLDEHKVKVEFGDGEVLEQHFPAGPSAFTFTRPLPAGVSLQTFFPIYVKVRDDDSAEASRLAFNLQLPLPSIDLDIDSDNDNKLSLPEEDQIEDGIEASATLPGKIILANVLDHTANGIPDFADGLDIFGNSGPNRSQRFAQLVLKIPGVINPQVAQIKFVYDADYAGNVTKDPAALDAPEADYFPGTPGSFRIWTRNGDQARKTNAVYNATYPGDWVPPSQAFALSAIAPTAQAAARTVLYVEGVKAADHKAITVLLDVDGDGWFEATDKVYVTIADLHIVYTDVTGIREVGGSRIETTTRIAPNIEPDGVATDWMEGVEDGSILLMRVVGSKSLEQLPSGFDIEFGMIDPAYIVPLAPFAPLEPMNGEFHTLEEGWVVNASGGDGKLDELGIAGVGADFVDVKHKVFGARFYRPPVEFNLDAPQSTALSRRIDLAVKVTGDVETVGSKARAIKLVRPPVILVHGINSEPGTWGDSPVNLDAQGFRSKWFVVDHSGKDPQSPQDGPKTFGNGDITHMWKNVANGVEVPANTTKGSDGVAGATKAFRDGWALITNAQGQVLDQGFVFPWANGTKGYRIAVQKVDVVAHSYGGLLTRWYIESPDKPDDVLTEFEKRRDVRKLVTLGTPHKGAPVSNIVAEIYKDGLIANAKAEGAVDGAWEAILQAMGYSPAWFLPLLTLEPTMKTVVSLLEGTLHTSLPGGDLRPSYQVFSVGSDRLAQLATDPFQDDVAYAAVIGTQDNLYGQNLYKAFQPLTGSSLLPGDDAHLFPWLYNLNRGSDDTDAIVPTWSAALGVESYNKKIEVNHLELTTNDEVFAQVREWLNSKNIPLGSEQRAAYDPQIPASFANAYVGSEIDAAGASYGAGLNRDAIIKVELDPGDGSHWYGTRSLNQSGNKFVFGTDPASLGSQTVAITGMVQRRSIGNVHAQIVADSTFALDDVVLDDLGQVQWADMFANPDNIFRNDTGSNDWVTFRIETGRLGRNRTQLMGPDGTAWSWGWVHYDMQVDNPYPGFEGFEAPPADSGYFYYEVVAYTLPPPQKAANNGLLLNLFGAVLASDFAAASQTNTVRLYDYDNIIDNPLDPGDDRIEDFSLTINHPPGTWDGLLIPYQTTVMLALANGDVAGNYGSSGEASAEVYQYVINPGWAWNLTSEWITVP